jgi:hypothetical protein
VVLQWGDGSGCEDERLEPGWVQWIMGVLSLLLLLGCSAAEGGRSRGGRLWRWNFNGAGYGKEEAMGAAIFGREEGEKVRRLLGAGGG